MKPRTKLSMLPRANVPLGSHEQAREETWQ